MSDADAPSTDADDSDGVETRRDRIREFAQRFREDHEELYDKLARE